MFRTLAIFASGLALASCTYPATSLAQDAPVAEAAAPTGPAMWKVSDEDTTIYLFGTVHFLPAGLDWYKPEIAAALGSAEEFVSEIDTSALPHVEPGAPPPPEVLAMAQRMAGMAKLPEGETLRALMNEEDRAQYETALAALNIPAVAFDGFEPWFVIINLTQVSLMREGIDPSTGVERTLDEVLAGKRRTALETAEGQFALLDALPMDSQLAMLAATVEALPNAAEGMREMIGEWMEGDADGLAALMNRELADPVLYQRLLTDRNAAWAVWIDERMDEPGTVFMAVGAGHLAGDDSVQAQLATYGIAVERVQY